MRLMPFCTIRRLAAAGITKRTPTASNFVPPRHRRGGTGFTGICLVLPLAAFGLVGLGCGSTFTLAADTAPSLRTVLTPDEFHRAGLDKLTPEELAFLSRRLLGQGGESAAIAAAPESTIAPVVPEPTAPAPPPAPATSTPPKALTGEAAFGQEERLRESVEVAHRVPKVLTSRIVGSFRGWSGQTTFRLENGQVWQQTDDSVFSVKLENPSVKIEKGAFNTYFLGVEGYGSRVKVRRVH